MFRAITCYNYGPRYHIRYNGWLLAGRPKSRCLSPGRVKRLPQPPTEWLLGVKRQGREIDHSPPTSTEEENVDVYIHFPLLLLGLVLNYLSTGTAFLHYIINAFLILFSFMFGQWPPLWSSGLSSWQHIQRSGFNSRRYQILWEVVGLEPGPLSLVSTIEELLGRKK
jgi:hypothetical protein